MPERYRGHEIDSGYSVVSESRPIERGVSAVPAGAEVEVKLRLPAGRPGAGLVLADIPAGFEYVEGRERGANFLLRRGRELALLMVRGQGPQQLSYRLRALYPGSYRLEPARLLDLEGGAVSEFSAAQEVSVLSPGQRPPLVPPTPDELFRRGQLAYRAEQHREALETMEMLWNGWRLNPQAARQAVETMFSAALQLDDRPRLVKYFELAKEKNPALVVPFDKLSRLQLAYREAGAFEAGLQLGRASAEAALQREMPVLAALEEQGELAEALAEVRDQLDAYPHSPARQRLLYGFGQVLLERADEARENPPPAGFDRRGLLGEGVALLQRFLAFEPKQPQLGEAAFCLASTLLELEQPARSAGWCQAALKLEPDGDFAPALRYLGAFALFRQGFYDQSLAWCRQVIEQAQEEENRQMARYIMAQILHARGRVSEALEFYRQVADFFRDATETVLEAERELLRVEPIITAPPVRKVKIQVELRNVRELSLRAYPVDPLRLSLLKGGIGGAAQVNLSGIRPLISRTVKIASSPGVLQRQEIELELGARGAFLVLLRGGSRTAQTLVLPGGLQLEVLPASSGGRVRIAVRTPDGTPAAGARLQLKDQQERFLVGRADLRGIFLADELSGRPAVVAEKDGAYGVLPAPVQGAEEGEEPAEEESLDANQFQEDLVQGQLNQQLELLQESAQQARQFFKQKTSGVSAEQAR